MSAAMMGLRHSLQITDGLKIVATFRVAQEQRRLCLGEPAVPPRQHRDEWSVEIAAHVGQEVFVSFRRLLIATPVKDAAGNEA